MWRKLQPELLKKIISIPREINGGSDTNAVSLKASSDGHLDNEKVNGCSQTEFAVGVTVVRYFTKRQVKIARDI